MTSALATPTALAAGTGALTVHRIRGRSVATRVLAASPLRFLLPENAGHAQWAYITSYGGGLVEGDALALDVHVAEHATAMLATQASTKVYRATAHGARQHLALRVDEHALAVVLPDPVVCFAGARFAQSVDIDLAQSGSVVWLDTLHAGRVARGERWAFSRYASRVDLRRAGRLVSTERLTLDPAHGPLAARMADYDAFATVILAGDAVAAQAAAILERVAKRPPAPRAARIEAATPLAGGGALLRIAAHTAAEALSAVREHLAFVPDLIGDDPFARRW